MHVLFTLLLSRILSLSRGSATIKSLAVGMMMISGRVDIRREYFVYDTDSFIADASGHLGSC